MRVVIYVRVSTNMQVEDGYSLDGQIERCKAYAVSQGWEVVFIYIEEGESAKDMKRPELQKLMEDAENGVFDVLLVYKLDRLTRSSRDLHTILDKFDRLGIKFRSATEIYDTTNAMGRLFISIVAALAEWERANLAERVRFGMETLVQDGKWHGGPVPEGYTWDGEMMHIVPEEERVLRELRRVYMAGNGFGATGGHLNSRGFLRRGGRPWNQFGVEYVLSNPFYAGKMKYGSKKKNGKYANKKKDEQVDVIWSDTNFPTIFTWDEYVEHTDRMKRRQFYGTSKNTSYWFTGVLRCSRCGKSIYAKPKKTPNGTVILYMCSGRTKFMQCDLPTLRQNVAEKLIMEYISGIQLVYSEVAAADEKQQNQAEDNEDRLKDLQKQLSQILARKKKWQYMFAEDMITESEFRDRKREDDLIESSINEQIDEAKAMSIGSNAEKINLLIDLPELWHDLDDFDKREMMQTIFENIFVECDVKTGAGVSKKGQELPFRITDVIYN